MARYEALACFNDGTCVSLLTSELRSALTLCVDSTRAGKPLVRVHLLDVLHFRVILFANGASNFFAEEILGLNETEDLYRGIVAAIAPVR